MFTKRTVLSNPDTRARLKGGNRSKASYAFEQDFPGARLKNEGAKLQGISPAPGLRYYTNGTLYAVGYYGFSWSAAVNGSKSCYLDFNYGGLNPQFNHNHAHGFPMRCLQE